MRVSVRTEHVGQGIWGKFYVQNQKYKLKSGDIIFKVYFTTNLLLERHDFLGEGGGGVSGRDGEWNENVARRQPFVLLLFFQIRNFACMLFMRVGNFHSE